MALRKPLWIATTITLGNGSGAKQALAVPQAGAPSGGFINSQNADGFGFSGKLRAATGNSGTVTLESNILDSAAASQLYTLVLAAGEESPPLENVDLASIVGYGSAAGQKLHVIGTH